jgi:hypothetical protein
MRSKMNGWFQGACRVISCSLHQLDCVSTIALPGRTTASKRIRKVRHVRVEDVLEVSLARLNLALLNSQWKSGENWVLCRVSSDVDEAVARQLDEFRLIHRTMRPARARFNTRPEP